MFYIIFSQRIGFNRLCFSYKAWKSYFLIYTLLICVHATNVPIPPPPLQPHPTPPYHHQPQQLQQQQQNQPNQQNSNNHSEHLWCPIKCICTREQIRTTPSNVLPTASLETDSIWNLLASKGSSSIEWRDTDSDQIETTTTTTTPASLRRKTLNDGQRTFRVDCTGTKIGTSILWSINNGTQTKKSNEDEEEDQRTMVSTSPPVVSTM